MMKIKKSLKVLLTLLLFLIITSQAHATSVSYDLSNLGGSRWEYTYSIISDTLLSPIEEFTIFFNYGLYDNLEVTSSSGDWDEFTVDPDLILGFEDDGFYDAYALGSGIGTGANETGFSVSFDWLGALNPGSQYFEIVDTFSFSVLDSGFTEANAAAPVPEPGTILLMGFALVFFVSVKGRYYFGLKAWG